MRELFYITDQEGEKAEDGHYLHPILAAGPVANVESVGIHETLYITKLISHIVTTYLRTVVLHLCRNCFCTICSNKSGDYFIEFCVYFINLSL